MMFKQSLLKTFLFAAAIGLFGGCAGGGLDSGGGGSQYESDALVQLIQYETLRNLLIENFGVATDGVSISYLDDAQNRILFGAENAQGSRNLSASTSRLNAQFRLANFVCQESMERDQNVLFPDGDNLDALYIAARGRGPSDLDREVIDKINALSFASQAERLHAQCVACLAGLGTHLK